jgi:hypothetical protein
MKKKKGVLMLNVIDMSEMRLIKKYIFLLLSLFFSCSQLGAMCLQTVGPISIDDGTWSLLSRIGSANNVIQSQICTLDFFASMTTIPQSTCIQFGQADIGAGGTYTITDPGVYCMYNDATWSTGAAITVNANNVTIDMQNHTLNGNTAGATGILVENGSNVTIKNGNITDPVTGCIEWTSSNNWDIVIQNMNLSVNEGTGAGGVAAINLTAIIDTDNNLLIENCNAYNCYISVGSALSAIVRGCILTCDSSNSSASITMAGTPTYPLGQVVIEDCVLANIQPLSFPTNPAVFSITNGYSVVIRNCISSGSGTNGFDVESIVNTTVFNCVAQQSVDTGFFFLSGLTAANLSVTNCVAQECSNGFWVKTLSGPGYQSALLTNSVAQYNTENGFEVTNDGTGSTSFNCMNCTANGNTGDGFEIGIGGSSTAPIGYGVLSECSASQNSANGYVFSSQATEIVIEHCSALANAGWGFIDQNTSSPSTDYYIGCRALGNVTGSYEGSFMAVFNYEPGPVDYGMNLAT